jgi:hypothetical protein
MAMDLRLYLGALKEYCNEYQREKPDSDRMNRFGLIVKDMRNRTPKNLPLSSVVDLLIDDTGYRLHDRFWRFNVLV